MSTRFFTNNGENTLLNKFAGVFRHNPDIDRFDALVGYLRASGYFALRPYLEKVPHIHILVGINVDAIMADPTNHKAAGHAMAQATALFVAEYAESTGLAIPFRRSPSFNNLFRAVFPEEVMDPAEKCAFRPLIPYFFASYEPADFNQALLDEAIRLILHTGHGRLLHLLARRAEAPSGPVA